MNENPGSNWLAFKKLIGQCFTPSLTLPQEGRELAPSPCGFKGGQAIILRQNLIAGPVIPRSSEESFRFVSRKIPHFVRNDTPIWISFCTLSAPELPVGEGWGEGDGYPN